MLKWVNAVIANDASSLNREFTVVCSLQGNATCKSTRKTTLSLLNMKITRKTKWWPTCSESWLGFIDIIRGIIAVGFRKWRGRLFIPASGSECVIDAGWSSGWPHQLLEGQQKYRCAAPHLQADFGRAAAGIVTDRDATLFFAEVDEHTHLWTIGLQKYCTFLRAM